MPALNKRTAVASQLGITQHMNTSSPFQFALRCCVFTVGVGLMLPQIPWLLPLGLLVVIAAGYMPGGDMKTPKFSRLFTLLVLIMAQVMLGVWQSTGGSPHSVRSGVLGLLYDIVLLVMWAQALLSDYRKWRSERLTSDDA